MTMTRAEIVNRVCEKKGLSKDEATNGVEATFDIIKSSLERGQKVKIMNFGVFAVRAKSPRRGHNPQTGAEMIIAGRKVVTFKASEEMKKRVNGMSSTSLYGEDSIRQA